MTTDEDLEITLPMRYVIPELVRQQGTAKILDHLVRIYDAKASMPVWRASDWPAIVDKRYAAWIYGVLKEAQGRVHKLDLERLRDLEEGPTTSQERWEQERQKERGASQVQWERERQNKYETSDRDKHAPGPEKTPPGE